MIKFPGIILNYRQYVYIIYLFFCIVFSGKCQEKTYAVDLEFYDAIVPEVSFLFNEVCIIRNVSALRQR